MPDGGTALTSAWIWLILLLLAALAGLVMFTLWQRGRTRRFLQQVSQQLRTLERSGRQLGQAIEGLSVEEGEPYGSQARRLRGQLASWRQDWAAFRQEYVALQNQESSLKRLRWPSLARVPGAWYGLQQGASRLAATGEQLEARLAALGAALAEVDRLAWQVAQRVQTTVQQHTAARQALQRLKQRGLQGEELSQAEEELNSLQETIAQIHPLLCTGKEGEVLAGADHAMVIQAHARLNQLEPAVPSLYRRVQSWQEQVDRVVHLNRQLQQSLQQVSDALQKAPENLDLADDRVRFGHLQQIAVTLDDTVSRLEVGSLAMIRQEAERLQGICQEMLRDLQQAYQQQLTLEQGLSELEQSLPSLVQRMAALATARALAVRWQDSKAALEELQHGFEELAAGARQPSPSQLPQAVNVLQDLLARRRALSEYVQEVESRHSELVLLLRQLRAENWLEGGLELARQASEFGPQNWPAADAVQTLPEELEQLRARRDSLPGLDAEAVLAEEDLPGCLETARELAQAGQAYQQRLRRVQQRLAQLRQWEKQAQEQVEQALITVGQLRYLARSNDFLAGLLGAELEGWQAGLKALQEGLQRRERDTVEKKKRQADEWTRRIEQKAAQWLQQLQQEIRSRVAALKALLASLDQIAPLAERAPDEARRVMGAAEEALAVGAAERTPAGLVSGFKRLSDLWQECRAAEAALEDIARPLLESHAQALENRNLAQSELQEAVRQLRPGSWPPFSNGVQAEQAEFRRVEADWQALPRRSWRAMELISQLERLAARYLRLSESIARSFERASRDQDQVLSLEQELDGLAQSWSGLLTTYADSPNLVREIRSLLNRLQYQRNQLKQRVKMGNLEYAQVIRELERLRRETMDFKAPLDANHAVDVEGQVIRWR